jgi:hypothetical protein
MHRILLLLCLIVAALPASAADTATSGPNADSTPLGVGAQPAQSVDCPTRPPGAEGAPSDFVVELDPDTLWRPRGAEVRFTIRGPASTVIVKKVRVCFGWSSPGDELHAPQRLVGSPQVRSVSNDSGVTEYGAVVPRLRPVPWADWWPRRLWSAIPFVFTGAGTVPVADMVIEITPAEGAVVTTAIQVGITNSFVAWLVVVVVAILVLVALYRISRKRKRDTWSTVLWVISTPDGQASLSQFQIVIWTVVVGMSAIYVMTLSGNLISIGAGTLTLLGIAGGAALVIRIPGSGQPGGSSIPAGGTPAVPRWSDLIIPDRQANEVDVTRLQMLAFTLIAAGFVMIKVVVDYEIPTIPTNFLILMGISNGVYMTGRKWTGSTKSGDDTQDKAGNAGSDTKQAGTTADKDSTAAPAGGDDKSKD